MKKFLLFIVVVAFLVGGWFVFLSEKAPSYYDEKIYVAVEAESKIAVLDPISRKVIRTIDLSVSHDGGMLPYAPHNIQVAPDGKSVWVTANAGMHEGHTSNIVSSVSAHGEKVGSKADEIIVILPQFDEIIKRIPVARGVHLAHVVFTPDSVYAYVTAQNADTIYKVDARTFKIVNEISTPEGSEPHGLRIAPDGSAAYVAMLEGKSLGILALDGHQFREVHLRGKAVQAGVTPDGGSAFASLYDTKQLALYNIVAAKKLTSTISEALSYIDLPSGARGPVQMYPTPDSKFVYLADQGYYFNQPESEWVYKIDLDAKKVVKEIKAGRAPHGVVVSKDGTFVYVTNLLSGDVSVIETATDVEIARIPVGKEPNGISVWSKTSGGTP